MNLVQEESTFFISILFVLLSLYINFVLSFRLLMCELYQIATQDGPKELPMLSLPIDLLCLW